MYITNMHSSNTESISQLNVLYIVLLVNNVFILHSQFHSLFQNSQSIIHNSIPFYKIHNPISLFFIHNP